MALKAARRIASFDPKVICNKSKENKGRTIEHADTFAVGPRILLDLLNTNLEYRCCLPGVNHGFFDEQFLQSIQEIRFWDSPSYTGIGDDLLKKVPEGCRHVPGKPFLNRFRRDRLALTGQVTSLCIRKQLA